ncbi:hypothetical protein ACW2AL_16900 [Providencia sp. PROV170]|nr:hypothetical protein [Providencia rettgeri]ELR5157450.1 hypothetical protein [Providencia rettgeri]ELR5184430.1 hypothetical protein [Providencia rettgeri]ELR5266843.1 hypothetical protein [Providencia rettgeri]ELR5276474.1 hypothetical protein [Providencia rettgeri]
MEFKGTPAPWFIEEYDINGKCDAKYFDIRSMSTDGYEYMDLLDSVIVGDEKALANAHLIAAAPELFDTLQELIQTHEYSLRIGYERIIELGGDCDSPEIMINKDSSLNKAKAAITKALGQQ